MKNNTKKDENTRSEPSYYLKSDKLLKWKHLKIQDKN